MPWDKMPERTVARGRMGEITGTPGAVLGYAPF